MRKALWGVMTLAASKGTTIEIEANGTDEDEAMSALVALIEDRFGEDQ